LKCQYCENEYRAETLVIEMAPEDIMVVCCPNCSKPIGIVKLHSASEG
jgi:hypothetical protein